MGFNAEVVQLVYIKKTIEFTELTGGYRPIQTPNNDPLGGSIYPISCMDEIKLKRHVGQANIRAY